MAEEVDRFCHSLFAYLYLNYKDCSTSELAAGLPIRCNFAIPDDFDKVLGDSQIYVNKAFRPYFHAIFDKSSVYVCRTEKSFKDFVARRCSRIRFDSTEVSILTICAVVTELNLYCFQRDCFRFASYAPICLAELLRQSNTIMRYLTNESEGAGSDSSGEYEKLKTYCLNMFKLLKNNPAYIPGIIDDIGKRFKKMKDKPVDFRIPMSSTMSTLLEGEEDDDYDDDDDDDEEEDETAPLMDHNFPPLSPEECRYCRGKNCSIYLQQFEKEFRENYN